MREAHDDDTVRALYAPLLARLRGGPPVRQEMSALVDDAVRVWSRPGFETFLSLAALRFEPFDYQVQAARVALRRMRGRAILADEVGLGKTIEAGLILAELRLRGLADRTLVITPAGLVTQWQGTASTGPSRSPRWPRRAGTRSSHCSPRTSGTC